MNFKKTILLSVIAFSTMAMGATKPSKAQLAEWEEELTEISETQQEIAKHDGDDNLKWGADLRTSYDNINYDLADGTSKGNDKLMSTRLWLKMKYSFSDKSTFIGQLSMNKTFGADFQSRAYSFGAITDWTTNEALADSSLKLREAYWLYRGESFLGTEMPWSVSVGRRPSVGTFLANLAQDDEAASSLGHIMNAHVDALSLKVNFEDATGIPGMGLKFCAGIGSTNAEPLFTTATPYANDDDNLDGIKMASVEFQVYNDSRFILKSQWYGGYNLPGADYDTTFTDAAGNIVPPGSATHIGYEPTDFQTYGDLQGFAISGLVDGITEEGYFSDAKVFASFGMSRTEPGSGQSMLGSSEAEVGTSYWIGAYLPVGEENIYGTVGVEYNHGDKYWRPFTYAEDTMIGSKVAVRGDAYEANYTYHFNEALSFQARYVYADYDYAGSNGMFGSLSGTPYSIDEIKSENNEWNRLSNNGDPTNIATIQSVAGLVGADKATKLSQSAVIAPNLVESAQDVRVYLRYKF